MRRVLKFACAYVSLIVPRWPCAVDKTLKPSYQLTNLPFQGWIFRCISFHLRKDSGFQEPLVFNFSVERFDPRNNRWTPVASMGTRRKHLGVAVFNNMIYAVGGRDDTTELSSAERYNSQTNSWQPVVAMTSRRSGVSLSLKSLFLSLFFFFRFRWAWGGECIYIYIYIYICVCENTSVYGLERGGWSERVCGR